MEWAAATAHKNCVSYWYFIKSGWMTVVSCHVQRYMFSSIWVYYMRQCRGNFVLENMCDPFVLDNWMGIFFFGTCEEIEEQFFGAFFDARVMKILIYFKRKFWVQIWLSGWTINIRSNHKQKVATNFIFCHQTTVIVQSRQLYIS